MGKTYIVTECCPFCGSEIIMRWDCDELGYKAYRNCAVKPLVLTIGI